MQKQLEELLKQLELKYPKGSSICSKSHLKMALYDWNKERNWDNPNAYVLDVDSKGYIFFTFTTREPKHCTIRHLFTLEEFRNQGIGRGLIVKTKHMMIENNISRFRFFVNKPAISFYKKLGFQFIGESKQGLPFVYCDFKTLEPIYCEKQLNKLYKTYDIIRKK